MQVVDYQYLKHFVSEFGQGQDGSSLNDAGGGGGGWYGGKADTGTTAKPGYGVYGGGGGSGYIGGVTNGTTIAGDQSFAAPGGGTETGHSGDGYARITLTRW